MAYAAKGVSVLPALVHVARDQVDIARAEVRARAITRGLTLVRHMQDWLSGAPPPAAPDLGIAAVSGPVLLLANLGSNAPRRAR